MPKKQIDINIRQCKLDTCQKCINRDSRNKHCEEGVCEYPSALDNLPIRCVGDWANDKIYYLTQYFGIFATGMHKRWEKLYYVEVCSGPGRCSTRDGFEQDGTAIAILNHPSFQYITNAVFVDYNNEAVNALNKRIELLGKGAKARSVLGDYNDSASITNELMSQNSNGLTLCLIDPTDCSLPFKTIEDIYNATNRHCDFIISFFDGTDLNRNCAMATLSKTHSRLREKYERFLGDAKFFQRKDIIEMAKLKQNSRIVEVFTETYKQRLARIGLAYSDTVAVGSYYHLLFVSSHQRGIDFWRKASKTCLPNGQRLFNF